MGSAVYKETDSFLQAFKTRSATRLSPVEILLAKIEPVQHNDQRKYYLVAKVKVVGEVLFLFEYIGESEYSDVEELVKITGQRKAEFLASKLSLIVDENIICGYRQGYVDCPFIP